MPSGLDHDHGDPHVRESQRGQTLVEFSVAFIAFAAFVFGIIDGGRLIYQFNASSQAAREIARVASVHPGTTLGSSPEITAVIDVQKDVVPNLQVDSIECVSPTGTVITGDCDYSKNSVKVTVSAPFKGLMPPLMLAPVFSLQASSTATIQ